MRVRTTILISFITMALLCGCSTAKRHKVLSFFFDGVPEPGKASAGAVVKDGRKGGDPTQAPAPRYKEHGPYAAKECQACHLKATSSLLLPVEELCINCHSLDVRKKHIHGPLASGGCKVCHEPHGSLYPFLLVSEPKEFCLHCHDRKAIANSGAHKEAAAQCTMCHDAHSSDKAFLLK